MNIIWLICSYLIGSIPFGLLVAKTFCKIDPRLDGSKSIGATNVARLCGFKYGVLTLLFDLVKGGFCVFVAYKLDPSSTLYFSLAAFLCLCGHTWSIFLAFKGGKAVASTIGIFLMLAPIELIIAVVVCLLVIWRTNYVSAGSLTLVALMPILLLIQNKTSILPLALAILILIIYTHRTNIKRLLNGTEKTWKKQKN